MANSDSSVPPSQVPVPLSSVSFVSFFRLNFYAVYGNVFEVGFFFYFLFWEEFFMCAFFFMGFPEEGEPDSSWIKDRGIYVIFYLFYIYTYKIIALIFYCCFYQELNESRSELLSRIQGLKQVGFSYIYFLFI